jgi:beta-lactamase regulating signal transducer with metallopeptidase domain
MTTLLEIGLSNAMLASGLALAAWTVGRIWRHPKIAFLAWLVVLGRLLAPPLVGIPWHGWRVAEVVEATPEEIVYPWRGVADLLPTGAAQAAAPVDGTVTAMQEKADVIESAHARRTSAMSSRNAQPDAAVRVKSAATWRMPSLGTLIGAVWLCGSALWLSLAAARILRFKRTLARAEPAGAALVAEAHAVARRMGLVRVPDLRLVSTPIPPLVWALASRPTIVLPKRLVGSLSPDQRATLLAHEMAHLTRRDHLVRLVEMAALAVYWWHPVAWWARRQIARAGEQCCDAEVVARFPALNRAYAEALVATVEFFADSPPAVPVASSGLSQVSQLRRRLEMILAGTVVKRVRWPLRLSLAALAAIALTPFVQSVNAEPQVFQPKPGTIDERLERLEKAMQALTSEIRAMRVAELENANPVVVKTVPENGAQDVDPGLTEIRVTFNKDMHDGTWSWTQRSDDTFPEVTGKPHYVDKRTCVLPVKLEAGKTYHISINSERFRNFKDVGRRPAIPYPLDFKTK